MSSENWDIKLKDYRIAVTANEDEMTSFINEQVNKLVQFTADTEERLLLRHTPTDALKRIIVMAQLELASRSQSETT